MKALLVIAAIGAVTLSACSSGNNSSSMRPPLPQRCNADSHRDLIGKHFGALDFPAGSNVRVVCTTCASTQDFQRDRLTIRYNQDTGLVTSVECG